MKHKYIALLLITGLAVTFLSCSRDPLEKSRAWLEQGELDKARTALEDCLDDNAHWHEARALLVEVELAAGEPVKALQNIITLLKASYGTSTLENSLRQVLNKSSSEDNITCILSMLEADSARGQDLAQYVLDRRSSDGILVAAVLPELLSAAPENQWLWKFWQDYIASKPGTAWDLSAEMPGIFREEIIYYLASLTPGNQSELDAQLDRESSDYPGLHSAAADLLEVLLTQDNTAPADPKQDSLNRLNLLLLVNPEKIDSRHILGLDPSDIINKVNGNTHIDRAACNTMLDLLVALEGKGYESVNQAAYREAKKNLLRYYSFETVPGEEYFRGLSADELWNLVIPWLGGEYPGNPHSREETMNTVARVLGTMDSSLARALKLVISPPPPPQPKWTIAEAVYSQWEDFPPIFGTSFSPDGSHMVYHDGWHHRDPENPICTYWINLEEQDKVMILDGEWARHWSADSSKLALSSQEKIQIFSSQGVELLESTLPAQAKVMGWQNENLLIVQPEDGKYTVIRLNVLTGATEETVVYSHEPALTTAGKAGAVWLESGKLTVNIEGEITEYSSPSSEGSLHSWLPGDKGLVWENMQNHRYYILDFAQSTWTTLIPPPEVSFQTSWHGEQEIYAAVEIEGAPFLLEDIMIYNIDTAEMTHTGISRCLYQTSNSHIFDIRRDKGDRLEIYMLP